MVAGRNLKNIEGLAPFGRWSRGGGISTVWETVRPSVELSFCLQLSLTSPEGRAWRGGCVQKKPSAARWVFPNCGGERGIRTPGGVTLNGFQDRRIRPLCHLSVFEIEGNSKNFQDLNFEVAKVRAGRNEYKQRAKHMKRASFGLGILLNFVYSLGPLTFITMNLRLLKCSRWVLVAMVALVFVILPERALAQQSVGAMCTRWWS